MTIAEFRIGDGTGRRTVWVRIFRDFAVCNCGPASTEVEACAHIDYARRLLEQPCRVALQWMVTDWGRIPEAERAGSAIADWYREATEALRLDDERIHAHLRDVDQAVDPRSADERLADAVAMFNTPLTGGRMSPRARALDAADTLADHSTRGLG